MSALHPANAEAASTEDHTLALYRQLRAISASCFGLTPRSTLTPTALVHEVFLKLAGGSGGGEACRSGEHFLALAARAMRQIVVDRARARAAAKRGGGREKVALESLASNRRGLDVLDLENALKDLAESDPRSARLVELRFFCDLTVPQAAVVLGVHSSTAEQDWRFARAWLMKRLKAYGPRPE